MRAFSKTVVGPYIKASGYQRVCEIGSCEGANIDRLLAVGNMKLTVIDPCADVDLVQKYTGNARVRVCRGLSLATLKTIDDVFDCIMIDGDHNWYTVFHELVLIHEKGMLAKQGTIFLHDVGWPYARRDMYYDLDTVPVEFRQPHAKGGILRGVSPLTADPTEGKNGEHWNATHEGGPRNGVLTAVEDFRRDHAGYKFLSIQREWGLGVLVRDGENAKAVAQLERKIRRINTTEAFKTAIKTATGRLQYVPR